MEGDGDYERFFATSFDVLRRAVVLAVGDQACAEDAVAEAFARAYRRWGRVARMDDPRAWVYVVAINVARRHLRRRRLLGGAPASVGGGISADIASQATASAMTTALLDDLTGRQRAAVVLRYLADLPYADIGRALGCAEATARATVHQALQRMRSRTREVSDGS